MPLTVSLDGLDVLVTAAPLTREAFAPFGEVVQNPRPDVHPSRHPALLPKPDPGSTASLPYDAVSANQGSAIKYQHVTRMVDLYSQAPSKTPGVAVMNMFVCAARKLQQRVSSPDSAFEVSILERHPFTTQTFTPLTADPSRTYLVIVAPSMAPSDADASLPIPLQREAHGWKLPGRGLPDLRRLKAFVAMAEQAVTYGAGTWHAPMVALGPEGSTLDFVVVQFANGVGIEDCQEVEFPASGRSKGRVVVSVPQRERQARL